MVTHFKNETLSVFILTYFIKITEYSGQRDGWEIKGFTSHVKDQ